MSGLHSQIFKKILMLLTLAKSVSFSVESSEDSLFSFSEVIISGLNLILPSPLFLPSILITRVSQRWLGYLLHALYCGLVAPRIGYYSSCKLNFICEYKIQGYYCLHQINQKLFVKPMCVSVDL